MDQVKFAPSWAAFGMLAGMFATAASAQEVPKSVLVIHPAGASFEEAEKGIHETLGSGYSLKHCVFAKETSVDDVVEAWKSSSPKIVVAMDNKGISLAKEARKSLHDTIVPLVGLMGVRVDAAMRGMSNSEGINYEIPAVTSLVNLRALQALPIRKAGVVYREAMEDFFQRNAEFCKQENIELVGIKVPEGSDAKSSLEKALKELVGRSDIDALWVINDNFFLNAKLIVGTWQPGLSGWKHPVVVGIETLVKPAFKFGTFAVLPDNYALGAQAAGLVQEIEDAGWKVEEWKVDQPLSVIKTLNRPGTKNCCGIDDDKLAEVDKVLE